MTEQLAVDRLAERAESLFHEGQDVEQAISLNRRAAALYVEIGNIHSAGSVLMKMGLSLLDHKPFFRQALEAFEEASRLFEQDGNREGYCNALLNAVLVAERLRDTSLAVSLSTRAGRGYEGVASAHWKDGRLEFAWDSLQLACTCWKKALENAGLFVSDG